jgi:hypothetical protein
MFSGVGTQAPSAMFCVVQNHVVIIMSPSEAVRQVSVNNGSGSSSTVWQSVPQHDSMVGIRVRESSG